MDFNSIIDKKKKEWECPGLMDGAKRSRGEKIPFSSPLMNYITYGGIPRNKITEFFGAPGAGKSTSCIDICRNAYDIFKKEYNDKVQELSSKISSGNKQANVDLQDLQDQGPKKVLYVDLEHSFDEEWSRVLGIEPDTINIMQPPDVSGEEILNTIMDLIESGEVGLIVLDSLPSLVPKAELEKSLGERTVASLAGLLTVFCRKLVPMLTRYETTMVFINQIRDNMDNPYVVKTPGGKAPEFYASLRILFSIGTPIDFLGNELPKNTDNPSGYIINAKITKQKSAPFNRKLGSYYLLCDKGIYPFFDFAKLALNKYGIIKKAGGWFSFMDPETEEMLEEDNKILRVQGLSKVYNFLESHEDYYEKIKSFILNDIEQDN